MHTAIVVSEHNMVAQALHTVTRQGKQGKAKQAKPQLTAQPWTWSHAASPCPRSTPALLPWRPPFGCPWLHERRPPWRPSERAAPTASDCSVWYTASGLVWFGLVKAEWRREHKQSKLTRATHTAQRTATNSE